MSVRRQVKSPLVKKEQEERVSIPPFSRLAAKTLQSFDEAVSLLSPASDVVNPIVLSSDKIVGDAVRGANIMFRHYVSVAESPLDRAELHRLGCA